jgi:plastocyanin
LVAGVTVTWQNGSSASHTVTSSSTSTEIFNSGNQPAGVGPGATFSHTFPTAGTYHYYCQYQGLDGNPPTGMAGTITVQ